jgi:NADPH:quinone reductase
MRAIYIQKHGDVSGLEVSDIPVREIHPGEVLVRVEASGINRSDVLSVQGSFSEAILPRVVGRDFAGEVVDGPENKIGLEVWGSGGDLGILRDGTHAEYVVIPESAVAQRPQNLSAEQAAAVGVPFITACTALNQAGGLQKGQYVIVAGAAGSVGQAAVQIAYGQGAHVIALVRDKAEDWISKSPGIVAVAESSKDDLGSVVRKVTKGAGANLALNGVGGSVFAELFAALAPEGRQVVYSAAGGREVTVDLLNLYRHRLALSGVNTQLLNSTDCARILTEIAPLFEAGKLQPPAVNYRYSLEEARQAYQHVAAAKGGKVVLLMT